MWPMTNLIRIFILINIYECSMGNLMGYPVVIARPRLRRKHHEKNLHCLSTLDIEMHTYVYTHKSIYTHTHTPTCTSCTCIYIHIYIYIHMINHPGPASQWLQDVLENPVTEPLQPLRLARLRRPRLARGAIPGGMEDPAESEEEDELGHLGGDCHWVHGKICEDHQLRI